MGAPLTPPMIRARELGPPPAMAEVIPLSAPRPWEVTAPRPQGPEVTGHLHQAQVKVTTPPRPRLEVAAMMEVTGAEAA